MSQLLRSVYKRLKTENPAGKLQWDDAISTLRKGDHYVLVLWKHRPRADAPKDDPGNKVIKYGSMFLAVTFLLGKLVSDDRVPSWISESFGALLFVLFLLTMFFLAQQGYRAFRRRKSVK